MKTVVITGGRGFFSYELVRELSQDPEIRVIVLSSDPTGAAERIGRFRVEVLGNDEFLGESFPMGEADCLVHTAFCRKDDGAGLVKSLRFSEKVFRLAAGHGMDVINISSQSVYGTLDGENLPDENASVCPGYPYAVAKAASEILLESVLAGRKDISWTSIRLASLVGPGYKIPDNITKKFIVNALAGKEIRIVGGAQKFSFLDVRDAAEAVHRMIGKESCSWNRVYNLGNTEQTDIIGMSDIVNHCVELAGRKKVPVRVEEGDIRINTGMDSGRFYRDFGWVPCYRLEDTVRDCISVLLEECGAGKEKTAYGTGEERE